MAWYQIDVVDGKVCGNIIVNANSIEEAEAKVAKMQEEKQKRSAENEFIQEIASCWNYDDGRGYANWLFGQWSFC